MTRGDVETLIEGWSKFLTDYKANGYKLKGFALSRKEAQESNKFRVSGELFGKFFSEAQNDSELRECLATKIELHNEIHSKKMDIHLTGKGDAVRSLDAMKSELFGDAARLIGSGQFHIHGLGLEQGLPVRAPGADDKTFTLVVISQVAAKVRTYFDGLPEPEKKRLVARVFATSGKPIDDEQLKSKMDVLNETEGPAKIKAREDILDRFATIILYQGCQNTLATFQLEQSENFGPKGAKAFLSAEFDRVDINLDHLGVAEKNVVEVWGKINTTSRQPTVKDRVVVHPTARLFYSHTMDFAQESEDYRRGTTKVIALEKKSVPFIHELIKNGDKLGSPMIKDNKKAQ